MTMMNEKLKNCSDLKLDDLKLDDYLKGQIFQDKYRENLIKRNFETLKDTGVMGYRVCYGNKKPIKNEDGTVVAMLNTGLDNELYFFGVRDMKDVRNICAVFKWCLDKEDYCRLEKIVGKELDAENCSVKNINTTSSVKNINTTSSVKNINTTSSVKNINTTSSVKWFSWELKKEKIKGKIVGKYKTIKELEFVLHEWANGQYMYPVMDAKLVEGQ